jgi:hypothetical protein
MKLIRHFMSLMKGKEENCVHTKSVCKITSFYLMNTRKKGMKNMSARGCNR